MIDKQLLEFVHQDVKQFIPGLGRCQKIAEFAQQLLAGQKINTTICKGSACWRVGKHPLALVSFIDPKYLPYGTYYAAQPDEDGSFHTWLETEDGMILDFTSYNFAKMVRSLDVAEGAKTFTPVTWSPNYIYAPKSDSVSTYKVLNGKTDKLFFYKAG